MFDCFPEDIFIDKKFIENFLCPICNGIFKKFKFLIIIQEFLEIQFKIKMAIFLEKNVLNID